LEDLTGKQLGSYRVVAPLGEGGMAVVYKAYQAGMDRYVALKILPRYFASDPQFLGRFEQEAKVLARLLHPHILPVHDYGEVDGYTYIVMPFVESGTLADLLEGDPLPLAQIRRIIAQIGDALDYAHSQGVIHRDVKPSNILVDQRGNCLLTDFGIAKMVEGSIHFTRTGGIVGTPAYMSPEQIQGEGLDGRSDVYSLGIVLYEMATGRPPYRAETPPAIFVKHLHDPLPPPSTLNSALPESIEQVILKALAKKREDRYATAGDMVQALQSAMPDTLHTEVAAEDETGAVITSETVVEEPELEAVETELLVTPTEAPEPAPAPVEEPPEALGVRSTRERVPALRSGVVMRRVTQVLSRPIALVILAAVVILVILGVVIGFAFRPLTGALDSRLAFVSDRDGNLEIHVMDEAGEVTQLTRNAASDADPSWSPNKARIAFASDRDGNWEVYWANTDGAELTRVTRNPASDTQPAWSPNGDYIAFTSDRDGKREVYLAGPEGIARVTHTPGDAESWEPAWGPNNIILFTSNRDGKRDIYHTNEVGEVVRITHTPGDGESWSPAWAWGGDYTAFVSNRDGPQEIYTLSEGGMLQRISRTPGGRESWEPAPAAFGELIAFTSDRAEGLEIYTITEEGVRQVTHTPGSGQSWSPAW
jgi:Tol biopolymer transport system component/predicted Ser/Thr protein kinase